MMIDTAKAKATLESQLAELQGRLQHIEDDLDEPHDPDSSERAVQVADDDSLEGQARLVEAEIAATAHALERIAAGEYGLCVQCGADIAPGRLEARPEAALCIDCASKG